MNDLMVIYEYIKQNSKKIDYNRIFIYNEVNLKKQQNNRKNSIIIQLIYLKL